MRAVGDLVEYLFDTGAMHCSMLYGVVIKAGPKSFTVLFESGIKNRRPQGCHLVKPCSSPEEATAVLTRRGVLPLGASQKARQ